MIDSILEAEKCRIILEKEEYENQLKQLPRGTLITRTVNGNQYCYFRYREGKRIKTVYAGPIRNQKEYENQIEKRDKILDQIKHLDYEIGRIEKMESIR